MGIHVSAGGEVRVKQTLQESKGAGEPGCLCELGELPAGECRDYDPLAVGSRKVTGEAAIQTLADPDFVQPGPLSLGEEAEMASDGAGVVFCRQ